MNHGCWNSKVDQKTFEDRKEKLHNNEKTVINVSFRGFRKTLTAGCEADVVSITRLGWIKF